MNILIMGGPGAGKGTMPTKAVEKFNINRISTGDTFRSETGKGTALSMGAKSPMDKGLLAPDEVVNNMVKSYLEKLEDEKNGFLLDGYPRAFGRIKIFDVLAEGNELVIDKVITLEIDLERLTDHVTGRHICKECGEIYHAKSEPGKTDNACDICGRELFQRKDDTVEGLIMCLEEYSSQTAPVPDYCDSKRVITRIDANRPIDSAWNDTLAAPEEQGW